MCKIAFPRFTLAILALSAGALVQPGAAPFPFDRPAAAETRLAAAERLADYGQRLLTFEANEGQADARVDFLARSHGYTLFLTPTGVTFSLIAAQNGERAPAAASNAIRASTPSAVDARSTTALRMRLVGANRQPTRGGFDELPGKVNYFLGSDPAKWRANIATYGKVRYREVYPGIDLVYYGNQLQLEYDFIVAPGIDPATIALEFEGADQLEVDAGGDLRLHTAGGSTLRLQKPVVYQETGGVRQAVAGGYALEQGRVSFRIGAYDSARPLVIDPVFVYSTPLGGRNDDGGYAIAVDAEGNAYVTGDTTSANFPLANPLQRSLRGSTDVFVVKLSADGSRLLYATYLGGSDADVGYGIAVDAEGNAYITGDTRSSDFPLANPLQRRLAGVADIFVAKLSADGARLLYSTYFGGSGGERGLGIAVDASGNAHVTGYTNSTDFPTANPLQPQFAGGNADAFVLKLNASGSALIYATYLGGGNDRPDIGTAIAVDREGNAYVAGFTNSVDFPTFNSLQAFAGPTDIFVTKLNPTGSLVYSTYLGGSADDEAMGIAVDAEGNAYVTGHTESPNFPTTTGAFRARCVAKDAHLPIGDICLGGDAFVSKLSADGRRLVYSTYLSGSRFEVGRSIAVDSSGNAYVAGITSSPDFPVVHALQKTFGGGDFDAFVVKLNPSGSDLIYSTYLGGSGQDGAYGVAVDGAGNVYVTGLTSSPDFPTRNPLQIALRRLSVGLRHAFVAKIADDRNR